MMKNIAFVDESPRWKHQGPSHHSGGHGHQSAWSQSHACGGRRKVFLGQETHEDGSDVVAWACV